MNQKIAIMLSILIISVGFRDVFTILYFYGNRTFIAENLCINKDLPKNTCQGKCILAKQLEESNREQDESIPLNGIFDHLELKVLPTEISVHQFLIESLERQRNWNLGDLLYQSGYFSSVFHPPKSLS